MTTDDSTPHVREPTGRDWTVTAALLAIFVAALAVGIAYLAAWGVVAVAVTGLGVLVWWHARRFGYRCPNCGAEFTVGPLADLVSPSVLKTRRPAKQLKCPACGQRALMTVGVRRHPK